jgi:hypothetical protein
LNSARTVSEIVNADIKSDAAIALSKLATGALPAAITVASDNLVDGTIVNADINASAAIAGTKVAPNFGSQNIQTTGTLSVTGVAAIGATKFNRQDTSHEGGEIQLARASDNAAGWFIDSYGSGSAPHMRIYDGETSTQRVVIDGSGNVGINSASPTSKLTVVDNSANDAVRITQTGSGNALVVEDSANPDATPFVVTADGRVCIGGTSPTASFHIQSDLGASGYPMARITGSTAPSFELENTSAPSGGSRKFFRIISGIDGNVVFENINDAYSNSISRMCIRSDSGNVGINNNEPTERLEVNGTVKATAFSGPLTGNVTGTASAIADGSVSTAKIVDGNVTNAKLASDIDASKLTTGTLPIARIADAAVTPAKLSQPLTLATAQATTSGTSIDFTGIPSWVKRITVMLNGVSTNGTSLLVVRLGTSSGFVSSGYSGSASSLGTGLTTQQWSSGFGLRGSVSGAADTYFGSMILSLVNASTNTWSSSHAMALGGDAVSLFGAGGVSLASTLTQVRITTVGAANTFDAGSVNIMYEG